MVMIHLPYDDFLLQKYVQDLIADKGPEIASMLLDDQAHFYVCGDCKMAEEVQQQLRQIMKKHANLSDEEVENVILEMMVSCKVGFAHTWRSMYFNRNQITVNKIQFVFLNVTNVNVVACTVQGDFFYALPAGKRHATPTHSSCNAT